MFHSLAMVGDTVSGLSVDNPFVLGPIAAFIFTVFVMEIIVPGKAYRREVEENTRLRALVEKVVPLAEALVAATTAQNEVSRDATRALEHAVEVIGRRR